MHKILHPKADAERLYISGKDGGRGLIDIEAALKSVTIGLNHYLRHKEWQYPKQFENRGEKSTSENAKALKHILKSKMKSINEEKWKSKHCMASIPGF
ncbi:unnamed protein product [Pocillopora meandrina]|uniref:Uncharacterized protein n=1 Tax=Pocillopora meandrina TaxID=46732 RepID=A0AAU9XM15_9CNID|nr:unnamed protein product [Pocillopora meandrina]